MKKYFLLLILGLTQCKTLQTDNSKSSVSENQKSAKPYFKAIGVEPFWNINISENQIVFTSLLEAMDTLNFDYAKPILAMDANVKNYRVSNADWALEIQMIQQDCSDTMSDQSYNYKVDVSLKGLKKQKSVDLSGCGNYILDIQLIDNWILERLGDTQVSIQDFSGKLPFIEFNNEKNTFHGYAGCNAMHGQLFFEKNLLRFINIATTRKFCDNNQEPKFLQLLHASTEYKIEQNKLYLSNPDGLLLVFQKTTNE